MFEGLGGQHQGFAFYFDNREDGSEPICCKEGQGEKRMFLVYGKNHCRLYDLSRDTQALTPRKCWKKELYVTPWDRICVGESLLDYPGGPSVSTRYLKVDKGHRKKVKEMQQENLPPPPVLALEMELRDKELRRN